MYIQNVNLNVNAQPDANAKPCLRLSQNENGRVLMIRIIGVDIPEGSTANFAGVKPDGNVYSKAGTVEGNVVSINEDIQMTAVSGAWNAKITVVNDGNNICTARIRVVVDASVVPGDAVPSDSQLDGIVAECQAYAESAKNAAYGSPLTANTAAGMTDQDRVYVYTGSETGYTAGHWYYYDGSAWADGGVYNAVAVQTDTTLSLAGSAADAKATGDAVTELNTHLTQLTDLVIDQPYSGVTRFTIGGISVSNGKTLSLTTRLRMLYTRVSPSSAYRFEIEGTDYVAMFVHFYSSNVETSWLGNPLEVQGKASMFIIPDGANYIRIVFKDATDNTRTMEESDVTALTNAFHLYQTEASKKERTGEFIRFTVKDNHRWTDNASTTTDDAESSTEVDHLCIITLPESYTSYGKKTPLIMYCHGASCGITDSSWYGNSTGEGDGANFLAMVRRFTSEGYAIFDVDNTRHVTSGFNDWGSLPLMSAYIKAWEYIRENYNVESDLYLLSASMGTPVAQNMMKWYKGRIKTALILAPRPFGIKGRWDETYATITDARKKEFLVAWGLEDDEILSDDTFVVPAKADVFTAAVDARFRGFYHYENMTTIDGTNYVFEKFPPMKVMVGLNDTSFLSEVRAYYAALQNFGNYVNYREVTGKSHGAMCTLVGGELLDEGVAWFERFRYSDSEVTT